MLRSSVKQLLYVESIKMLGAARDALGFAASVVLYAGVLLFLVDNRHNLSPRSSRRYTPPSREEIRQAMQELLDTPEDEDLPWAGPKVEYRIVALPRIIGYLFLAHIVLRLLEQLAKYAG